MPGKYSKLAWLASLILVLSAAFMVITPASSRADQTPPGCQTCYIGLPYNGGIWAGSFVVTADGSQQITYCSMPDALYPDHTNYTEYASDQSERGQQAGYLLWRYGATTDTNTAAAVAMLVHRELANDWRMYNGLPAQKALADKLWQEAWQNRGPYQLTGKFLTRASEENGFRFEVQFDVTNPMGKLGFEYRDISIDSQQNVTELSVEQRGASQIVRGRVVTPGEQYGVGLRLNNSPNGVRFLHSLASPRTQHLALWQAKTSDAPVRLVDRTPQLATTAADFLDFDKQVLANGQIVDELAYSGLEPGQNYRATGELYYPDGTQLPASSYSTQPVDFVPAEHHGKVQVLFDLLDPTLHGKSLVIFETISDANGEVISHKDLTDVDQTVTVLALGAKTYASDAADGDKYLSPGGVVKDEISFKGLTPGVSYHFHTELMRKIFAEDGSAVIDPTTGYQRVEATGITLTTDFTPKTSDGKYSVEIKIPADYAQFGEHVFFEKLSRDQAVIVDNKLPDNPGETIFLVQLGTNAIDQADGDKTIALGGSAIDQVNYAGLVPGREYLVRGVAMIKRSDGVVESDWKAERFFTPSQANGQIKVVFDNAPAALAGATVVYYEQLFLADQPATPVAVHQDPNSVEQSVQISPPIINTGQFASAALPQLSPELVVAVILLAAAAVLFFSRK